MSVHSNNLRSFDSIGALLVFFNREKTLHILVVSRVYGKGGLGFGDCGWLKLSGWTRHATTTDAHASESLYPAQN